MYELGPVEVELNVPAWRLWAAFKDLQYLLPKILPVLRPTVLYEGDGGAGSIQIIKFPADVSSKEHSRVRIDVSDDETYTEVQTLIGGETDEHYSFYRSTRKFIPTDENSTIASWSVEYEPIGDHTPESGKQLFLALSRAMEAYLLSHDEYL